MPHHQLQSLEKSHPEVHLACAKSLKTSSLNSMMSNIFPSSISWARYHHIPFTMTHFLKQPSHHLFENVNTWMLLSDWHKQQYRFRSSWIKYWRIWLLPLPTLMESSSTAKLQKNIQTTYTFFYKFCNATLSMKLGKCHFFVNEIQYLGQCLV